MRAVVCVELNECSYSFSPMFCFFVYTFCFTGVHVIFKKSDLAEVSWCLPDAGTPSLSRTNSFRCVPPVDTSVKEVLITVDKKMGCEQIHAADHKRVESFREICG